MVHHPASGRREPVQRRDEVGLEVGSAFSWMTSDADVCRTNAAARRPWPRHRQESAAACARELGESLPARRDAEVAVAMTSGTALMMSDGRLTAAPLCCWTVTIFSSCPAGC